MVPFSSPDELRAFTLNLADELARSGEREAADCLRLAATFPATTSSEWLGELGLAVREVQQKHRPPAEIQAGLDKIMSAVNEAWPRI